MMPLNPQVFIGTTTGLVENTPKIHCCPPLVLPQIEYWISTWMITRIYREAGTMTKLKKGEPMSNNLDMEPIDPPQVLHRTAIQGRQL